MEDRLTRVLVFSLLILTWLFILALGVGFVDRFFLR